MAKPLAMWNRWLQKQREHAQERRLRKREAIKEKIAAAASAKAAVATQTAEKIPPAKKSRKSAAIVPLDEPLLDELEMPAPRPTPRRGTRFQSAS